MGVNCHMLRIDFCLLDCAGLMSIFLDAVELQELKKKQKQGN